MVAVITPGGNNGSVVKNKMKIRWEFTLAVQEAKVQ